MGDCLRSIHKIVCKVCGSLCRVSARLRLYRSTQILQRKFPAPQGGPRFVDPGAKTRAGLPGPGQYAMPAAVGRQPSSMRPSTPSVGFPRAHRDAAQKVSTCQDLLSRASFVQVRSLCFSLRSLKSGILRHHQFSCPRLCNSQPLLSTWGDVRGYIYGAKSALPIIKWTSGTAGLGQGHE